MDVVFIALLTVVASSIGVLTGFGTSTVMLPVAVLFYPVPEALLLVGVVHWFGNLWKLALFHEGVRWRLILGFGIPGIALSALGAWLVLSSPPVFLGRVVGGLLAGYATFLLRHDAFRIAPSVRNMLLGGGAYGFTAGLTGVGGAVRSAFLTAFELRKAVFIVTSGAIGLFIDTSRLAVYLGGGIALSARLWWGMLLFIPASLLGAHLARVVADYIPEERFRAFVAVFLLVAGLKLLILPEVFVQ